jgi:hypothetical protein
MAAHSMLRRSWATGGGEGVTPVGTATAVGDDLGQALQACGELGPKREKVQLNLRIYKSAIVSRERGLRTGCNVADARP